MTSSGILQPLKKFGFEQKVSEFEFTSRMSRYYVNSNSPYKSGTEGINTMRKKCILKQKSQK